MTQLSGKGGLLFSVVAAALLLVPAPTLADECEAEFRTELTNREEDNDSVRLNFKVEVSATEKCAIIVYEFLVNVETPEGEEITHRQEVRVRVTGEPKEEKLMYEMPLGHRMVDYEAKQVSCSVCESP